MKSYHIPLSQLNMIEKLNKLKSKQDICNDTFVVVKFKPFNSHYLGLNNQNHLALLISSGETTENKVNFRGKYLEILFNTDATISFDRKKINEKFTVLQLKNTNDGVREYFIDICSIILQNLGEKPTLSLIEQEVIKVKQIFLNLSDKKIKEELGLWGELFLIANQKNKKIAINSWHINPNDRIDFNTGKKKIEVKTTISNYRKHIFKLYQLRSNYEEDVLICSIMTNQIDGGKSIQDLIDQINHGLDNNLKLILKEKISRCLGSDLLAYEFKYFDYKAASSSIRFYNSKNVPSIETKEIPSEIAKVQFESNLEKTKHINVNFTEILSH